MKRNLPYIISAAVCLVISIVYILFKKIWAVSDLQEVFKILCDAFFTPGALALCSGGLIFAGNKGAFHMFSFGLIKFFDMYKKDENKSQYKDFYEYSEAKKEKQHTFLYLVIVGLVFIGISLIFMLLFNLV